MKAFYSDRFVLPVPAWHRFPMTKYRRLRERVREELPEVELREPPAACDDQLALAHDRDYIQRASSGALSAEEQRAIGFPWSPMMVERARRSVGATIEACRVALDERVSVNLAGGTHHAFRDRGQGYCVFNDAAVATRVLVQDAVSALRHVAIIDLDVHQGNGTASIFAGDASVFTLSLHGAKNFPFRKETSCIDVGLPDGTGDVEYLEALEAALRRLTDRFAPDFLIYLSGADAHAGDRLGRLALSNAGMSERDRRVLDLAASLRVPIAVTMAGGYGTDIETTVDVHFNTVRQALEHWQRRRVSISAGGAKPEKFADSGVPIAP